jgi:hypothetical protein
MAGRQRCNFLADAIQQRKSHRNRRDQDFEGGRTFVCQPVGLLRWFRESSIRRKRMCNSCSSPFIAAVQSCAEQPNKSQHSIPKCDRLVRLVKPSKPPCAYANRAPPASSCSLENRRTHSRSSNRSELRGLERCKHGWRKYTFLQPLN